MMTCKDVCERATEHLEGELGLSQRIQLRFHLLMCKACRRFLRQFQITVGTAARVSEVEEPSDADIEAIIERLSETR